MSGSRVTLYCALPLVEYRSVHVICGSRHVRVVRATTRQRRSQRLAPDSTCPPGVGTTANHQRARRPDHEVTYVRTQMRACAQGMTLHARPERGAHEEAHRPEQILEHPKVQMEPLRPTYAEQEPPWRERQQRLRGPSGKRRGIAALMRVEGFSERCRVGANCSVLVLARVRALKAVASTFAHVATQRGLHHFTATVKQQRSL